MKIEIFDIINSICMRKDVSPIQILALSISLQI